MADQPSPRRRFQFRLRTLMLFVTLACVIASWIGWRLYLERLDDAMRVEVPVHDPYGHERMIQDWGFVPPRAIPPRPPPDKWPPPRDLLRP